METEENADLNEQTFRNFDTICRFCLARDVTSPQQIFDHDFDEDRLYIPEFVSSFTNLTVQNFFFNEIH